MSKEHSSHSRVTVPIPYQTSFVEFFTKPGSPTRHLLVAPPGTGKTHTACTIVDRLADRGEARAVLILTPSFALRTQWTYQLMEAGAPTPLTMDRAEFRELQAAVPVHALPWPASCCVVVGPEVVRHAEVFDAIVAHKWDIVIVDEAHRFMSRSPSSSNVRADGAAMIQALDQPGRAARMLFMTATPDMENLPPGVTITEWKVPLPEHEIVLVDYFPGEDEQAFMKELESFLDQQLTRDPRRIVRGSLLQQARSSIFCLEAQLQHWIDKLEGEKGLLGNADETENDGDDAEQEALEPWGDPVGALKGLRLLRERLESVQSDDKLVALDDAIRHEAGDGAEPSHLCVLTKMHRTAWYLASALKGANLRTHAVHHALRPERLQEVIEAFRDEGGVFVAPLSTLRGLELPELDAVYIYDDVSDSVLDLIVRRFVGVKVTRPLKVYALTQGEDRFAKS